MKAEDLIKNNAVADILVVGDQSVVFTEIALTAINMAKIEAYNQAIEDAFLLTDDNNDMSFIYQLLKLKKK